MLSDKYRLFLRKASKKYFGNFLEKIEHEKVSLKRIFFRFQLRKKISKTKLN